MSAVDEVITMLLLKLEEAVGKDDEDETYNVHAALRQVRKLNNPKEKTAASRPAAGVVCPCSWRPALGFLGSETLKEHQRYCSVFLNLKLIPGGGQQ